MKKLLCIAIVALFASPAFAIYNANMSGVVVSIATYAESDSIYFRLDNQPTSNGACNAAYFVIPGTVATDRRKVLLARLMLARTTGETINIGFDSTGDCADGTGANGFIRVHRVG